MLFLIDLGLDQLKKSSLNPWFITGFTDGDGSFTVSISKKNTGMGWKIQPIFTIGLDPKDLDLLVQIQAFFKIGKIYTSKRGIIYYTVGSTKDLVKYILPRPAWATLSRLTTAEVILINIL